MAERVGGSVPQVALVTGAGRGIGREIALRAEITERVQPGVVYTTFHFPFSGANVSTFGGGVRNVQCTAAESE